MKYYSKSALFKRLAIAISLYSSVSAQAHHSFVGEFDISEEFEIVGSVTLVEWFNPHVWLYLDGGKAEVAGVTEKWQCELGSPNMLLRSGWSKEDLPVGTSIRITGNPARDGSNTCNARVVTLDNDERTPVFSRNRNN